MDKTNTTGTTGKTAAVHVPAGQGGNVPPKPAAGPSAASSVSAYGGNRGGKPRADGLVPGSPEAKKADQEKDAKRKRDARTSNPPALPSAPSSAPGPGPTPVSGPGPLPGSPAPVQSDVVPWDPGTLKPLLQQIIDGAEQARIQKRRTRAVAVGLPSSVVEKSAGLAAFPGSAKTGLAVSGASGVAQIMNGLKISGKYQDPAIAVTCVVAILVSVQQSDAKFEEMIAEFKKSTAPKPTPKT